ncbi:hypothetical protein F1847_02930 [Thermodesulfobacterium sp. TA1]|uniref:hypothetical protein n=1 Tax=Thermodesulfobacterium sp. TA1 TaxID=2234087 RepID=UPI0012324F56|nr:hypothetical protein [Thermodesulfobacterium sp. TA1]QER41754.1 hypothetical protein F1847_02930 [Thermodesulfobacterium sp. TA1]
MGKFEGIKLELGDRAGLENIPPNKRKEFCNEMDTLYKIERNLIDNIIKQEVDQNILNDSIENFLKLKESQIDQDLNLIFDQMQKENKELKVDEILKRLKDHYAPELVNDILSDLNKYTEEDSKWQKDISYYETLYGDRNLVELCRANPIRWLILFILGAIAEVVILLIQAILGGEGFNPFVLIYGGLLAVGSGLLGYGAAHLERIANERRAGVYKPKSKTELYFSIYAPILIGIILILFVAAVRGLGDEFDVRIFLFTVLLGLVVSFFEYKHIMVKKGQEDAFVYLKKKQLVLATQKHKKFKENNFSLYKEIENRIRTSFSSKFEREDRLKIYKDKINQKIEEINQKIQAHSQKGV